MTSMYNMFKTDPSLEENGVIVDYGDFRVTIARAGGANKKFAKILEAKTRPFRRAIETETMDNARAQSLIQEVYAEAVVLKWEVRVQEDDKEVWKDGIHASDGTIMPFTKENVMLVFKELPDLYSDIQEQAQKVAIYRKVVIESASGN